MLTTLAQAQSHAGGSEMITYSQCNIVVIFNNRNTA